MGRHTYPIIPTRRNGRGSGGSPYRDTKCPLYSRLRPTLLATVSLFHYLARHRHSRYVLTSIRLMHAYLPTAHIHMAICVILMPAKQIMSDIGTRKSIVHLLILRYICIKSIHRLSYTYLDCTDSRRFFDSNAWLSSHLHIQCPRQREHHSRSQSVPR
jgi:hypothetical protein